MSSSQHNLTDHQLANVFRKLFAEHSALLSSASVPAPRPKRVSMSRQAQEFRQLLDGFAEAYSVATTAEAEAEKIEADEAKHDRPVFKSFLAGHREALKRWTIVQKDKADDFNLMAVMGLTDMENAHSDILAWLLDHDLTRLGTHAQGNLGFKLFLKTVGLASEFADYEYRVTRESKCDELRIDIEVAQRGKFVIYIEDKIWSVEGYNQAEREWQTEKEWRELGRRAEELGCPENRFAFYLTPRGTKPKSQEFRAISWRKIAEVFETFAEDIKTRTTAEGALTVSLFASHYAEVLRRHIVQEPTDGEESDASQCVQRGRSISPAKLGKSVQSRKVDEGNPEQVC